jgi:hypothetical protein
LTTFFSVRQLVKSRRAALELHRYIVIVIVYAGRENIRRLTRR